MNPEHAVNLDSVFGGDGPEQSVPRDENAPDVTFGDGECEAVVDGETRCLLDDFARAEDAGARHFDHLQTAAEERALLCGGELQQFVVEEGVRNQDLVRQLQEGREQRRLPEVDEAAAVTDDDPHPPAAPSGPPPL